VRVNENAVFLQALVLSVSSWGLQICCNVDEYLAHKDHKEKLRRAKTQRTQRSFTLHVIGCCRQNGTGSKNNCLLTPSQLIGTGSYASKARGSSDEAR
jgi:hypothetical protein